MAKATPSKSLGQLKDKLSKAEEELSCVKEKLSKEEDQVADLKKELKTLQKEFDTKQAQHEREMNRSRLAQEKVSFQSKHLSTYSISV